MRKEAMQKQIVIATRNKNKLREIKSVLEPEISVLPCPSDAPEVEEKGSTYEQNARLKAVAVARFVNGPAAADDTGFEVDALNGAPGLYSARYAGAGHNDVQNRKKLIQAMMDIPMSRRTARYRTVVVAHFNDGREIVVEGICEGTVPLEECGMGGFGYDAVFVPLEGDGRTFAEMEDSEKEAISHRAKAFRSLRDNLLAEIFS